MASKIEWDLPEGMEEILPPKALIVEKLRRKLIDLYLSSGYQLIIPPLLEFSDTLGGEAHDELTTYAFNFKDELSGKNLSIRPDISEQAARIDAYRIRLNKSVRLCYVGDVAKNRITDIHRSRITIQAGAEIFGENSMDSDLESIHLMVESLSTVGIKNITLSLGHAGLMSLILDNIKEQTSIDIEKVQLALSKKSESDIETLDNEAIDREWKELLLDLSHSYGGEEILLIAKKKFKHLGKEVSRSLDYIEEIINRLDFSDQINIHLDLGEIHGFRYHNGIVFSAYTDKAGYSLAKGGRYDGLSRSKEVNRPAVGFDLDLLAIADFTDFNN